MKRLAVLLVVFVVTAAACRAGPDPYLPRFAAPKIVAATVGPVTFTVGRDDTVYYAELRTFDVYAVATGELPRLLFHSHFKPDSLAVDHSGNVYVAARSPSHQLFISRFEPAGGQYFEQLVWVGNRSRFAAHIALASDGEFVVGWHSRLFRLNANSDLSQSPVVISRGYTDPVSTFGGAERRIWVADNALPGSTERVLAAQGGGEAAKLQPNTNPSGITMVRTELFLCSRTHEKVYRLHVDKDARAHWRGLVRGLVCDRDIASLSDGSVITAQPSVIYRYPPR